MSSSKIVKMTTKILVWISLLLAIFINYEELQGVNSHGALFTRSKWYNASKWSSHPLPSVFRDSNEISSNCTNSSIPHKISPNCTSNSSKSSIPLAQIDEDLSRCGPSNIDIREITVPQIRKYFESRELLSVGLTICYLRRIAKMNPRLRGVIEVNPEAVKLALKSDLERAMGINRGVLHGVPILIKDNIATGDEMQTTAGSLALVGLKPKRDARLVRKLRAAGAVILGKTNLSEFAFFRGTNVPDGWSSRGGQTMCPYVASVDPNGSSSGSAVAVAANLATVTLGSETDGSIATPASRQAIVGLKTTKGLVSDSGVIPLAFSQDVAGPMTRTVADAAILLQVIADDGNKDIDRCGVDITTCMDHIKRFRVGVVRDPYWNASNPVFVKESLQLERALRILNETNRVLIVDPVTSKPSSFEKISGDSEFTVFLHEFKHGINEYLNKMVVHKPQSFANQTSIRNLSDIIKFNTDHPSVEGYNQEILIASEETDGITNSTYKNLRDENKKAAKDFLDGLFDTYDLDAVVGPNEEEMEAPQIFSVAAIAGYPSIHIPVGFSEEGVPFGISFVGRAASEATLLKIGWLLEKSSQGRRPPKFK